MKLGIYNTKNLTKKQIIEYTISFNQAFNQKKEVDFFLKKYLNSPLDYSFHSFAIIEKKIVAACTIIPYKYKISRKDVIIGLVVDTFILKEQRKKDPFLLLKMYKILKSEIMKNKLIATVSVPNINAYAYWKKIVKCQDLMNLNYYITLNNKIILNFLQILNKYILRNNSESQKKIRLLKHKKFYKQRLIFNHKIYENDNYRCVFTFHNEKNKKIAYLIDFYNIKNNKRDLSSLIFSIENIKNNSADIIVFVGKIDFKQLFLLKIPSFLEPKKLNVIIDNFENHKELLNNDNWDFGLLNYDVR